MGQGVVVIVDLEEDCLTLCLEDPEVMFFMRVVGTTKIVIDRDSLDDPLYRFCSKSRDPWGYNDKACAQGLA